MPWRVTVLTQSGLIKVAFGCLTLLAIKSEYDFHDPDGNSSSAMRVPHAVDMRAGQSITTPMAKHVSSLGQAGGLGDGVGVGVGAGMGVDYTHFTIERFKDIIEQFDDFRRSNQSGSTPDRYGGRRARSGNDSTRDDDCGEVSFNQKVKERMAVERWPIWSGKLGISFIRTSRYSTICRPTCSRHQE